jgi:hypothetical protein
MRVIHYSSATRATDLPGYRVAGFDANANARSGRFFIFSAECETGLNLFDARRD